MPAARDPQTLLEVAVAAAVAAGDLLLERFRRPATGVERKSSSTDMVSDADRDAEALIRSLIGERRPGDAVLGEEGGRAAGAGDLLWVVDPLDGTTNYLYRQPVWAVSVACEDAAGARRPPRRVGGDRSGLGGLRPTTSVARVAGTALQACCWCPRRAASSA